MWKLKKLKNAMYASPEDGAAPPFRRGRSQAITFILGTQTQVCAGEGEKPKLSSKLATICLVNPLFNLKFKK